jgi:hypothetical protein
MLHDVRALTARMTARLQAMLARRMAHIHEQQLRRVRFEAEMYAGIYRHSSKNDDELPIAREPPRHR